MKTLEGTKKKKKPKKRKRLSMMPKKRDKIAPTY